MELWPNPEDISIIELVFIIIGSVAATAAIILWMKKHGLLEPRPPMFPRYPYPYGLQDKKEKDDGRQ